MEVLEEEKASEAHLKSQNKAQVELVGLQQEVARLKAQLSMQQIESQRRSDKLATAEAALEAANGRIREGESARRRLHDTVMVSQIR